MKRNWIFFLLINLAFVIPMSAQVTTPPKGKKLDAQQKEQVQIDEQLATQYFREQEYEKARDLYEKLYEKGYREVSWVTDALSNYMPFLPTIQNSISTFSSYFKGACIF